MRKWFRRTEFFFLAALLTAGSVPVLSLDTVCAEEPADFQEDGEDYTENIFTYDPLFRGFLEPEEWNGHIYQMFYSSSDSWDTMAAFCRDQGGYLASITSAQEDTFLYSYACAAGADKFYFGLKCDESGNWSWESGEPVEYTNWDTGKPGDFTEGEWVGDYRREESAGGCWNAERYDGGGMFLCEWNSREDRINEVDVYFLDSIVFWEHRYELLYLPTYNWAEKKELCEQMGGNLLCIETEEEAEFLYDQLISQCGDEVSIGLYYDGSEWKWVNGSPVLYANWAENQPDLDGGYEFFGCYQPVYFDEQWNDNDGLNGYLVLEQDSLSDWGEEPGEEPQGGTGENPEDGPDDVPKGFEDMTDEEKIDFINQSFPEVEYIIPDQVTLQDHYQNLMDVYDRMDSAIAEYIDEDGYVNPENEQDALSLAEICAADLLAEGIIREYQREEGGIQIIFPSGLIFLFQIPLEGTDGYGNIEEDLQLVIVTADPFADEMISVGNGEDKEEREARAADAASYIQDNIETRAMVSLINGQVTLGLLNRLPDCDVFLWHGHGGVSDKIGPFVSTNLPLTNLDLFLLAYCEKGSIDYSVSLTNEEEPKGIYPVVNSRYFEECTHFLMDQGLVYLATCESGHDDSLAIAFLEKGAETVFVNRGDQPVNSGYDIRMLTFIISLMSGKTGSGKYYSAQEALDTAYIIVRNMYWEEDKLSYSKFSSPKRGENGELQIQEGVYADIVGEKDYTLVSGITGRLVSSESENKTLPGAILNRLSVRIGSKYGTIVTSEMDPDYLEQPGDFFVSKVSPTNGDAAYTLEILMDGKVIQKIPDIEVQKHRFTDLGEIPLDMNVIDIYLRDEFEHPVYGALVFFDDGMSDDLIMAVQVEEALDSSQAEDDTQEDDTQEDDSQEYAHYRAQVWPGTYTVSVIPSEEHILPSDFAYEVPEESRHRNLFITLDSYASIIGTVIDFETGELLDGVSVTCTSLDDEYLGVTKDGRFTIREMVPGRYDMLLQKDGYKDAWYTVLAEDTVVYLDGFILEPEEEAGGYAAGMTIAPYEGTTYILDGYDAPGLVPLGVSCPGYDGIRSFAFHHDKLYYIARKGGDSASAPPSQAIFEANPDGSEARLLYDLGTNAAAPRFAAGNDDLYFALRGSDPARTFHYYKVSLKNGAVEEVADPDERLVNMLENIEGCIYSDYESYVRFYAAANSQGTIRDRILWDDGDGNTYEAVYTRGLPLRLEGIDENSLYYSVEEVYDYSLYRTDLNTGEEEWLCAGAGGGSGFLSW